MSPKSTKLDHGLGFAEVLPGRLKHCVKKTGEKTNNLGAFMIRIVRGDML